MSYYIRHGVVTQTYLCHHGIKGQKWGIRRYQNPDGTLTEEGRKRYSKIQKSYTNAAGEFSTTRSQFGTIGKNLALTTGGLILARALAPTIGGPAAVGIYAGMAGLAIATIIRDVVKRHKARNYIEVMGSEKDQQNAKASRIIDGILLAGPVGGLIGYGISESHVNKIKQAKLSEIQKK